MPTVDVPSAPARCRGAARRCSPAAPAAPTSSQWAANGGGVLKDEELAAIFLRPPAATQSSTSTSWRRRGGGCRGGHSGAQLPNASACPPVKTARSAEAPRWQGRCGQGQCRSFAGRRRGS